MDVIKHEPDLVGAYIIIVLFLAEQIRHYTSEMTARLEKVEKVSASLFEASSLKLLSLRDCVEDLMARLQDCDHRDVLHIDHLGLDMTHAWDHVRDRLLDQPSFSSTNYKILMISGDEAKFINPDEETLGLVHAARAQRKKIEADFKKIIANFKHDNKILTYEIHEYNKDPFIHGVHIRGPVDIYYIALVRWGGNVYSNFQWGETKYYRILGDQADNSVYKDLIRVFNGHFNHLWSL